MAIQSTHDKFVHELGDVFDAEHRFLKGQEEMLQKVEGMAPQLLRAAMQQEGTQPKGDATMGSMTSSGVMDQDVVVKTSGASDILIDDTRR